MEEGKGMEPEAAHLHCAFTGLQCVFIVPSHSVRGPSEEPGVFIAPSQPCSSPVAAGWGLRIQSDELGNSISTRLKGSLRVTN